MQPTLICTILFAASVLAAPIAQRQVDQTDSLLADLSSHAGAIDPPPPAPANMDIVLPPVTEVLALMAQPAKSPATSTAAMTSATAHTIRLGPGIVLPTATVDHIDIRPSASATDTNNVHPSEHIFSMIVVLAILAVIITIYTFSYCRHQKRMKKMATAGAVASENETEKGRCSVVDITRDFPRSKFSVTSSDYPVSTRFSASTVESECSSDSSESESDDDASNRGLINPAHFFALRAASMAARRRHSRGESAPVFGIPRYNSRREQSRRSQSVSGPRQELW
ncbi:hypothetical protein FB45DRAFT_909887 [Roridomyces roridus]|uniref:Uncharacterized protein n=1 Tax=Roridomyces roridus TaxID=1738132 RepID=A0AAD7C103_9AGAR|nr:hypothetical protein FB45DRAFT_909887 [Roridomyces roridus]